MTRDVAHTSPRPEPDIFEDLRALAAAPGYAHVIAFLCARDNFTLFSGEMTAEDLQPLYSRDRLIRTEIYTLVGLMMQARPNFDAAPPSDVAELVSWTETLLLELHESFNEPGRRALRDMVEGRASSTLVRPQSEFREAIFYGGEGGFSFQTSELAREKYAEDDPWLWERKGAPIAAMVDVAHAMDRVITEKISRALAGKRPVPGDPRLLSAFTVSLAEVAALCNGQTEVARAALQAFTLSAGHGNPSFQSLGDFNAAVGLPILEAGPERFLLYHFNALAEAVYESPFYWMMEDAGYRTIHQDHRGAFTETYALRRLEAVFGAGRVYRGVTLESRKGKRLGEIDVLVVFADRAVVLQAKSKRLTLGARRGGDLQIRSDFKAAVQSAYNQAIGCAERLLDPRVSLHLADGSRLVLSDTIDRVAPICVVADHYPALHFQTEQFLKTRTVDRVLAPLVIDLFALDALCEMLDRPLRLLSYLELRSRCAARIIIHHEMTLLAFHIKYNLWLDGDVDMVIMEDDFTVDLELAMAARRIGMPAKHTPKGILTLLEGRWLDQLLHTIEDEPHPAMIALGLTLYELSENAMHALADGVDFILLESRRKGQSDFSLAFGDTGLTVHARLGSSEDARERLEAHCLLRKHGARAERWFGLLLDAATGHIQTGGLIASPWRPDPDLDEMVRLMGGPATTVRFGSFQKREASK